MILVDTGIAALQGMHYFHWGVANIPGNDVGAGAEVLEYIPPFQVCVCVGVGGGGVTRERLAGTASLIVVEDTDGSVVLVVEVLHQHILEE